MNYQIKSFITENNQKLVSYFWIPKNEIKMVLQITHGMTEYMERYDELAQKLNQYGILVAGFDLRGHGRNNKDKPCASFGKNGWSKTVDDIHNFYTFLHKKYKNIPYCMLGFSLGSFLIRDYLNKYNDNISKVLICGTGDQPKVITKILKCIMKSQIKKFGFDETSTLVNKLLFETYNNKFKPFKTPFDWLCSDQKELQKYIKDDYCKKQISCGLVYQMLDSIERVGNVKNLSNIDKNIPILFLSGKNDPVGNMSSGVLNIYKKFKKANIKNTEVKIIDNSRHDLFHEFANNTTQKVYNEILNFILK